jgi:predicted dinucleotide-binding enzyme
MYKELSEYDQLLLAIEFHINGTTIPKELIDALGTDLVYDITNPIVNKVSNNDTEQNNSTYQ